MPLLLVHPDERARPAGPYELAWSLHPSVLIGTGLLGALYFWGIGPLRRRHNLGPPAAPWQIASFCAAVLVYACLKDRAKRNRLEQSSEGLIYANVALVAVLVCLLISGSASCHRRSGIR